MMLYGVKDADEELAQIGCLVGVPFVGRRAEDVIATARQAGGGKPVRLVIVGRAAIPAAHAFAASRELFSRIETVDAPDPWATLFADDAKLTRFADVVHNAWRFYDWTDLLKL